MNKKEQIVEILKVLLKRKNGKFHFDLDDIEKAIMECRGVDKRTLKNWWNFLWKLGFFHQEKPGTYILNVDKLMQLECPELTTHQLTLAEHTHTQIIKKKDLNK